ncbi:MAG TPA: response regulator [Burkholderiaceae bacterium]|nr:response regulator [Burkholderiaceae bacterium]
MTDRRDSGDGPDATARVRTDAGTSAARQGLRVLVAEDNDVNQLLIRTMLERMGHRADMVRDGVDAVRRVQAVTYDLVLMDVHMPVMNGLDATRAIRAIGGQAGSVPVVAMTAAVLNDDRAACVEAGMNGFVGKPVERAQLQQAIDEVLPAGRSGA